MPRSRHLAPVGALVGAAVTTCLATCVAAAPARAASAADVEAANRVVAEWAAVDQAIAQAQANLAAAEAALKEGRTPLPGERRGNVNGTSRLTPAYFDRVAALQQAVAEAREQLDAAYAERRTLPSRNYQGPVQNPPAR
jgi:hypothetical protein